MADSVFGDPGGSGKQSAGEPIPGINSIDITPPGPAGVFGDLGGVGTQSATVTAPEPGSGDFPDY
jgi:hypothetical protein